MRGVRMGTDAVAVVPLPRSPAKGWSRLGSAPSASVQRVLDMLAEVYAAELQAYARTQRAVAAAIAAGATWEQVGAVQGVKAQSAQYRYRRHVAAAP